MSTPVILLKIRSKAPQLNKALQKVAQYVLDNYKTVAYMGISQLAKASGTSEATITRFVKQMDFQNFKSFQVEIARSLIPEDVKKTIYGESEDKDNISVICRNVFANNMQLLQDTLKILDCEKIRQVSEKIQKFKSVIIYSAGRSSIAANSIRLRFYRLGIKCITYTDSHEQTISSCFVGANDVVIAISNSGRSASIVRNIKRAKEKGAYTVGITSMSNSPLTNEADITLYTATAGRKQDDLEPSCETVSQMVLLDCIYMHILLNSNNELLEKFYFSSKAMEEERLPLNNV